MKSSTIRRSNLSKEKMAVLEALSKYNNSKENSNSSIDDYAVNNEPIEDGSPEVYIRPNKEKELDLLWKDFRIPKGERSPIVYLGTGFIAGIITTLVVSAFIGMSAGDFHFKSSSNTSAEIAAPVETAADENTTVTEAVNDGETTEATVSETTEAEANQAQTKKFGFFGGATKSNNETATEATATAQTNREYEVQNGDTMEKIVKNFYGSYSSEKVDAIVKANNMKDANKLSIGQKLIIPAEGIVDSAR